MRHSTLLVMALLAPLAVGCSFPTHWEREELILPGNLPREQEVKIWRGDTVLRWHAVVYTRDSIIGIPYAMPTTCDSCRTALPQSAVDSIHVGYSKSPREKREAIGYMVLILIGSALVP